MTKILIIGPSWVGDMVMAQTLFIALKQQQATVQLDVLAPDWTRALLSRMPEINQALVMPIGHGQLALKQRFQLGRSLRATGYDQAIVLPNSWKSALIPWFANIPLRTGWRGEMRYGLLNDSRILDKKALPLMIQRFAALGIAKTQALASRLPQPRLVIDEQNLQAALAQFNLKTTPPVLALCPGAEFGPAKRWPAKQYAEVAKTKIAAGWQVWLFGSVKDQEVAEEIKQHLSSAERERCFDLSGQTKLADAIDLMSQAKAVISNDSGLMHIAAALKRPLVVVYGSSSPAFTPPLAKRVKILSLGLECSPCFERVCRFGHNYCLVDLPASQALLALDELGL